jgi:comEA protein
MKKMSKLFGAQAALMVLVLTAALMFAGGAVAGTTAPPGRVNINTADNGQMAALPGIGQSKAMAIIEYRSEHGPFPTVDSLANVRGIGKKLLEKIRPYVTTDKQ